VIILSVEAQQSGWAPSDRARDGQMAPMPRAELCQMAYPDGLGRMAYAEDWNAPK